MADLPSRLTKWDKILSQGAYSHLYDLIDIFLIWNSGPKVRLACPPGGLCILVPQDRMNYLKRTFKTQYNIFYEYFEIFRAPLYVKSYLPILT